MYLENKRAARRNREALLAEAGAGALAAFLGVPDATAAGAGAGVAAPTYGDVWGPRYSSGGELGAGAARADGVGDSVHWAPQSTYNGPTLDAAFEPRLCLAAGSDAGELPAQGARAPRAGWGVRPPLDPLHGGGQGLPGCGSGVLGASHGPTAAGSELNVFQMPLGVGRDGMGDRGGDVQPAARPQRRSWAGEGGTAEAGLSHHIAQHHVTEAPHVPEVSPSAHGARGEQGDEPRRSSGQRDGSPWPQIVDVDLAGWQLAPERHPGGTLEVPQAGAAGVVAGGEEREPSARGLKWGEAAEPVVGEGTARQLTAGTGVFATLSRPLVAQGPGSAEAQAVPAAAERAATSTAAVEAAEAGCEGGVYVSAAGGDAVVDAAGLHGQGRLSRDDKRRGESGVAAGGTAPDAEQRADAADGEAAGEPGIVSGRGGRSRGGPPDAAVHAGMAQASGSPGDAGTSVAVSAGVGGPHRPSADMGAVAVKVAGDEENGMPQQEGGVAGVGTQVRGSGGGGRGSDGGGRERRSTGGMAAYEAMMRDMAAALRDSGSSGSSLAGSSGSERPSAGGAPAGGNDGVVKELQGRVSEGRFMMDGQQVRSQC